MGDDLGRGTGRARGGRGEAGRRAESDVLGAIAAEAGLRRIHFVAWRDLDDPEAGGSELHAHKVASRWAGGRARRHVPHVGRARVPRPR